VETENPSACATVDCNVCGNSDSAVSECDYEKL
jgi:hypothetical protein